MSKEINLKYEYVDEDIKKILSLLKEQNYISKTTVLARGEREKLFKLLFVWDKYGMEESIWEYWEYDTPKAIATLNREAFNNMNKETRSIISKCGVRPDKIFSFDEGQCCISRQLLSSMQAYGVAKVGEYTIEITREHPINRDSDEIRMFYKPLQSEKYEKFKDGAATYRVLHDTKEGQEEIYRHIEGLHFGDHILFKGQHIGGYYVATELEKRRAKCIDELEPYFKEFEKLLSQNIIDNQYPNNSSGQYSYKKTKTK